MKFCNRTRKRNQNENKEINQRKQTVLTKRQNIHRN
jgi:hypothetical protein